MQLEKQLDLIGIRTHILEESKIGKIKSPGGDWGYLREYMSTYARESDPDAVIALCEAENLKSDFDLARYILRHDRLVD